MTMMNSSPQLRQARSCADRAFDAQRAVVQDIIAGIMAIGVVDRLKMVDVEASNVSGFPLAAAYSMSVATWFSMYRRLNSPVSASVIASFIETCTLLRSRSV
jgi:hypothetical protein